MEIQEIIKQIEAKEMSLSFSSLKQFAKSPEHFIRHKTREFKPTPAMVFGSLVHCVVLEPDKVSERYVSGVNVPSTDQQGAFCDYILSEFDKSEHDKPNRDDDVSHLIKADWIFDAFKMTYKRGDAGELYAKLAAYIEAKIKGLEVVSSDDARDAHAINDRLRNNKVSDRLLQQITQSEYELEWEGLNGWKCKGYVDGFGDDVIFDLKVTDSDPEKIGRFIHNGKYYVQAAMYREGLRLNGKLRKEVKILAVDREGNISVNRIDEDYLLYGLHEYKHWLQEFNKAYLMKRWRANYEFYGRHKGEFLVKKPYWADSIIEVYEDL